MAKCRRLLNQTASPVILKCGSLKACISKIGSLKTFENHWLRVLSCLVWHWAEQRHDISARCLETSQASSKIQDFLLMSCLESSGWLLLMTECLTRWLLGLSQHRQPFIFWWSIWQCVDTTILISNLIWNSVPTLGWTKLWQVKVTMTSSYMVVLSFIHLQKICWDSP